MEDVCATFTWRSDCRRVAIGASNVQRMISPRERARHRLRLILDHFQQDSCAALGMATTLLPVANGGKREPIGPGESLLRQSKPPADLSDVDLGRHMNAIGALVRRAVEISARYRAPPRSCRMRASSCALHCSARTLAVRRSSPEGAATELGDWKTVTCGETASRRIWLPVPRRHRSHRHSPRLSAASCSDHRTHASHHDRA